MSELCDNLHGEFPAKILGEREERGEHTVFVDARVVVPVMRFLRDRTTPRFEMLVDLTAVDYPERNPRFDVVYHLRSLAGGERLRVKCGVAERPGELDSVSAVFAAANWAEREAFDLYGIRFLGHPDLRRILLDASFRGHPLRKDYEKTRRQPVRGAVSL